MNAEMNHAEKNASAWMETISNYVFAMDAENWDRLENLREAVTDESTADDVAELARVSQDLEEFHDADHAREAAEQSVLSVEVRSGWEQVGRPMVPSEFMILLSCGGPALRIVGMLDDCSEPYDARLEYQDWGTSWTEYADIDSNVLDAFCSVFYFGE